MGNSIVSAGRTQPEPRFTGTLDTSKLDAALAQDSIDRNNALNASLEAGLSKQEAQVTQQGAANLSRVAAAQQAQANADFDASIVASQNAGAQRASAFVAQSDELFRDLGEVLKLPLCGTRWLELGLRWHKILFELHTIDLLCLANLSLFLAMSTQVLATVMPQ